MTSAFLCFLLLLQYVSTVQIGKLDSVLLFFFIRQHFAFRLRYILFFIYHSLHLHFKSYTLLEDSRNGDDFVYFFPKKKDKEKKIIWYFISETMFRPSLVDACDFKLFVFERINSVCIKCLKYQFTLFLKRFEFVNVTTIDVTNARRAFCVKDITIDILFVFAALC